MRLGSRYPAASLRALLRFGLAVRLWSLVTVLAAPFGELFLYIVYRKDLAQPLAPFRARVPITVARAEAEEIDEIARIESDDDDLRRQFRDQVRRGQICFVAWVGRERVAYDWLCVRPERVPGGVMAVRAGEVYCTDAYTAEGWRGNNIHPELNYRMLLAAQEAGHRVAYTVANVANPNSWKAMERVGWEAAGVALYFRARGARRARVWKLWGSLHPWRLVRDVTDLRRRG